MVRTFILQWHLSENCNLKCLHCYQEDHKPMCISYKKLEHIYQEFINLIDKLGMRGHINITGGEDLGLHEVNTAAELVQRSVDPEANIIFGASIRPELEDEIVITVVATGFDSDYYKELERQNIGATIDDDNTEGATVADAAAVVEDTSSKEPTVAGEDFAKENRHNMWDSIRTEESEEDLDVPPSLRAKFRRKK